MDQISLKDYYIQCPKDVYKKEWSTQIDVNARDLINRVNSLIKYVGFKPEKVVSGWRAPSYNRNVPNAAITSKHMTGNAIDLYDPGGVLDGYLDDNEHVLQIVNLYREHPASTKGWCHLQNLPPASQKNLPLEKQKRTFYP